MPEFVELCIERPVGSKGNKDVINLLNEAFSKLKYKMLELPLKCTKWMHGESFIRQNGNQISIFPCPFSIELKGNYPVRYVSLLSELKNISDYNGILIFKDELTKASLMPKNFPFYFPDEDKQVYDLIESIDPKGIIAISGQDPVSGLNPFPIFEDANFEIPSAYAAALSNITENSEIYVEINSKRRGEKSIQPVYKKDGSSTDIILIAAHVDSKYSTGGAVDNASGLFVLCEIAELLSSNKYNHTIEIVPFNGEDSPEVPGQLAYLEYLKQNNLNIKAVINIDGVGHIGSEEVFSFYNFEENAKAKIISGTGISEGDQWYSGDHAMFAFQEIPCIAVTASTMFPFLMKSIIHTKNDKPELVDVKLLKALNRTIIKIIEILDAKLF